jgi:hypothetical protein
MMNTSKISRCQKSYVKEKTSRLHDQNAHLPLLALHLANDAQQPHFLSIAVTPGDHCIMHYVVFGRMFGFEKLYRCVRSGVIGPI